MMAGIYLIFTLAIIAIYFQKRNRAIALVVIGILMILAMFWHHATDVLQINL